MFSLRFRFIIAVIVGISLLFASGLFAAETDIEEKMQELQEIEALLAKYEKLFNQTSTEENRTLKQIRELENSIGSLENEIGVLQKNLQLTEEEIRAVQLDIDVTNGLVNERTDYFNRRLRQIYQRGEVSYLEVLLRATSLTDFLTRLDYLEKIAANDVALLRELEAARSKLLEDKALLEEKARYFNTLKESKENKQLQLESQTSQKNNYLKSIQEQKNEYIKAINELEESRKIVDQFIREWQAKHQKGYMGTSAIMQWPVPGKSRISSGFGYRIHPIHKVRSFHAGIDIPAPTGTPVVAAENGIIIFQGSKTAYGNVVIIDHGGNISTQYSHLSKFANIQVGSTVQRGQVIGYVGSTGWSTGPHLDFIIRVNGEPQEPGRYVGRP